MRATHAAVDEERANGQGMRGMVGTRDVLTSSPARAGGPHGELRVAARRADAATEPNRGGWKGSPSESDSDSNSDGPPENDTEGGVTTCPSPAVALVCDPAGHRPGGAGAQLLRSWDSAGPGPIFARSPGRGGVGRRRDPSKRGPGPAGRAAGAGRGVGPAWASSSA